MGMVTWNGAWEVERLTQEEAKNQYGGKTWSLYEPSEWETLTSSMKICHENQAKVINWTSRIENGWEYNH